MDRVGILKRLFEIGEASNVIDKTPSAHDLNRIRVLVTEAQDFVLRTEKEYLERLAGDLG